MIGAAAAFSKIGTRHANEDSYAFWWAGDTFFAAIADGLGGMGGGGHASRYVVDFMRARAVQPDPSPAELGALLRQSHRGLQVLQQQNPEERSMATTLTVMAVRGRELAVAHCGDSRLYRVGDAGVEQVTEDHSEAQRLFREGRLSQAEFANYSRKYILESAIGIPGEPEVQTASCALNAGDWLVLATDGAYGMLEPDDWPDIARRCHTPRQFSAACLARIEARGPHDNYSMLIARVGAPRLLDRLKRAMWRSAADGGAGFAA